jgi:hypothetical protein
MFFKHAKVDESDEICKYFDKKLKISIKKR